MKKLLYAAGTSFLRSFGATFIMWAPGILAATNASAGVSLSIAGLVASLAAGFRAVQVFVPQLSFASVIPNRIAAAWADAFTRAALASFLVSITGWLEAPDYHGWRAAGVAAVTGAFAMGFRALQGLLSKDEGPNVGKGL